MKKNEVQVGGTYLAKVSDKVVPVQLDAENRHGGWEATNLLTGKKVRIKSAQRLRCPANRDGSPQAAPEFQASTDTLEMPESAETQDGAEAVREAVAEASEAEAPEAPAELPAELPESQPAADEVETPAATAETPGVDPETPDAPVEMPAVEAPAATAEMPAAETPVDAEVATRPGETIDEPKVEATKKGRGKKAGKADAKTAPKKLGAVDAAAKVLGETGQPMTCQELIDAMASKGYWKSPGGQTPAATLYAAFLRDIGRKGLTARFKRVERGKFALNG